MLTTVEVEAATNALVYPHARPGATMVQKRERAALLNERQANINALEAEWRLWLEAEYASDLPVSLLDELFNEAWSVGHSSGYFTVEQSYDDLTSFARRVVEAVNAQ